MAKKYAILRATKLKSIGSIAASAKHTYREIETKNADPARRNENKHAGVNSSAGLIKRFKALLPEKRRKNAVLGIEYLITASPEAFKTKKEWLDYFDKSLKWLRERHGRNNMLAAAVHFDETTPHQVVYVLPRDDKDKLNCRHFLGGRAKLSAMQTDFAKKVGEPHGLERGIKGSRAKHKTIKKFYAELNAAANEEMLKHPPGRFDKLLDATGFKTKRMASYEDAVAKAAAASLESRLDALRARDVVDSAEQELKQAKEQAGDAKTKYEVLIEELKREKIYLKRLQEETSSSPADVEAQRKLNEELKARLNAAETELERFKRNEHDDNSPGLIR